MILKEKDLQTAQMGALRGAIAKSATVYKRRKLEKELAFTRAGVEGEKEAAYHIDFHLKDSRNWMIIHDLRIEWEGRVAQIDHLIINRLLEMYVVESKNLKTKVRYQNGGWEHMSGKEWVGFPCPLDQNRRHILVLKKLVEDKQLAPTRLGVNLSPTYINVVVVNPACSIVGEFPRDARVWKMDGLPRELLDDVVNPLALLSVVASETLQEFAQKLVACHRPPPTKHGEGAMELRDKAMSATDASAEAGVVCEGCGGAVAQDEAKFCRANKDRFAGKSLCRKCQGFVPKATGKVAARVSAAARCAVCGAEVDSKVVAYCRFNSMRYKKRILCRSCQDVIK